MTPVEAAAAKLADAGLSENTAVPGAGADCMTLIVFPATVSVPDLAVVPVLAATEYATFWLPLPVAPLVIEIQVTLLAAVQVAVPDAAVTEIVPVEAPAATLAEVELRAKGNAA